MTWKTKGTESKTYLALSNDLEDSLLDIARVVIKTHMLQHHDRTQQQRRWVRKLLARNIRRRTVYSLKDGALVTNVARRCQTKPTDQASAHVGQNVTVQIGHDEHLVVVRYWVRYHLQARVVQQLGVELDVGVLLGDVAGGGEEETVGHLHDGSLVDGAHFLAANLLGVLECEAQDSLRRLACDELDALHYAVDDHVLDTRVLALGVLTDQDGVDIVVGGFVAGDRLAGTQVGEEVECSAERQVEGDMAFANGRLVLLVLEV